MTWEIQEIMKRKNWITKQCMYNILHMYIYNKFFQLHTLDCFKKNDHFLARLVVTCSFGVFFKPRAYILKSVHNESYLHNLDETCSFIYGKPASLVQNQAADFHPGLHNYQLHDHGEDIPFPGIQSHSNSGRDA